MKWTIAMTREELKRKTIIEQAIEKRITQKGGAERLGISERHFRRMIRRYRKQGEEGLVSGHRRKASNNRMKESKRAEITKFINDPIFEGFGPTLLNEKLEQYLGVKISKESMRQIMIEEKKHTPKIKKTKTLHLPRERRERRGELVQIDGSYHAWLEERAAKACLLLFVDDATSAVLAAKFVDYESFYAYGELCKTYFLSSGLPVAFYSDKFSVFRVNSRSGIHKEAITQFTRALNTLGIELICANSPQAKGRVERANGTFQDRLVKELRLQRIDNYQDANAYLPAFLDFYNRKFAVLPRSVEDVHATLDPTIDLDFLFAVHDTRTITKSLQIRFNGITYQIMTNRPAQYLYGREVLIIEKQSGAISAYLNNTLLNLQIVLEQPKQARVVSAKSHKSKAHSPSCNHPWRTYGRKLNGNPVLLSDH
jgi:transposase